MSGAVGSLEGFLDGAGTLDDGLWWHYGQLILGGHHVLDAQARGRLAAFHRECAQSLLAGETLRLGDFEISPTEGNVRHHVWLAEGLERPELAERLGRALPSAVRARVWAWIDQLQAAHPHGLHV